MVAKNAAAFTQHNDDGKRAHQKKPLALFKQFMGK